MMEKVRNKYKNLSEKVKGKVKELTKSTSDPPVTRLFKGIDKKLANFVNEAHSFAWSLRNLIFGKDIVYEFPKFEETRKVLDKIKVLQDEIEKIMEEKRRKMLEDVLKEIGGGSGD